MNHRCGACQALCRAVHSHLSSSTHCCACAQVLRRWDYGVMSDVTSVLYLQAPADMKGGNFRVWDPNVYDWGLRNATVQPAPTQNIVIKVRLEI